MVPRKGHHDDQPHPGRLASIRNISGRDFLPTQWTNASRTHDVPAQPVTQDVSQMYRGGRAMTYSVWRTLACAHRLSKWFSVLGLQTMGSCTTAYPMAPIQHSLMRLHAGIVILPTTLLQPPDLWPLPELDRPAELNQIEYAFSSPV